jgi:S-DNA-T family DNA segregation ATPase FtsK/SpoIIIE
MSVIINLTDEQLATSSRIALKIAELSLSAKFLQPISVGPIVSVYRFMPQGSTRVSHIEGIAQDLAIALGVEDVFVKRMPGESAVGIFVPNRERKWIYWRDIVGPQVSANRDAKVPLLLGVDHLGKIVVEDLTLMPHLLIAGSTGSGKSTLLSSLIGTIVYNLNSSNVKFVLSDTKGVEFGHFIGAPHLLFEPATSVYQTLERFDWLIEEMSARLAKLSKGGFRNVLEYNEKATQSQAERFPYIVLIIDELADLLQLRSKIGDTGPAIGKIAESKLAQLAQKARATGIHIIAATQRPSVKLVEGNIKANFPARLTFRLPSEVDSRTVIGTSGAEHLLSRGDMLFVNPNKPGLQRIHAPLASVVDIQAAVEFSTRRRQ